jgi:hypothetical protein
MLKCIQRFGKHCSCHLHDVKWRKSVKVIQWRLDLPNTAAQWLRLMLYIWQYLVQIQFGTCPPVGWCRGFVQLLLSLPHMSFVMILTFNSGYKSTNKWQVLYQTTINLIREVHIAVMLSTRIHEVPRFQSPRYYQLSGSWRWLSSGLLPCSLAIALMMEAANTSETLVNFCQTTRRNNPEDSHLHTRRREKLNSHSCDMFVVVFLSLSRRMPE